MESVHSRISYLKAVFAIEETALLLRDIHLRLADVNPSFGLTEAAFSLKDDSETRLVYSCLYKGGSNKRKIPTKTKKKWVHH